MSAYLLLFSCCLFLNISAQEKDTTEIESISTDRPDQSESPTVLPFKHFQMEIGVNVESEEKELSFVHPTILWRIGILKSTELRVTTDVLTQKDTTGKYKVGFAPMSIGFKTKICEERKARPAIAILSAVTIPYLSTKIQRTKYFAPEIIMAFEHSFKKNIGLGYNGGMRWDGFSPQPAFIYSVVNDIGFAKTCSFFYEFYGEIPIQQRSTHSFDTDITWVIQNNMQIDFSGGVQLFPFAKAWFTSIGYSFRVPN